MHDTAEWSALVLRPDPTCEERVRWHSADPRAPKKSIACCMHSCELITNIPAKIVLCHHAEVAKDFHRYTTDCVFCNVIGVSGGGVPTLLRTS